MAPVNEPFGNTAKLADIRSSVEKAGTATWKRSYFQDGSPYMSVLGADCVSFAENAVDYVEVLLVELDREHEESHKDRIRLNQRIMQLEVENRSIQQERDKLLRVIQHVVAGTEDAITEDYCRCILREFGVGEERT